MGEGWGWRGGGVGLKCRLEGGAREVGLEGWSWREEPWRGGLEGWKEAFGYQIYLDSSANIVANSKRNDVFHFAYFCNLD